MMVYERVKELRIGGIASQWSSSTERKSNKDGPPEKVVTDEVEIVTLSIPKLFEKQTCDILQLHEYQNAARLEREREREKQERERERERRVHTLLLLGISGRRVVLCNGHQSTDGGSQLPGCFTRVARDRRSRGCDFHQRLRQCR